VIWLLLDVSLVSLKETSRELAKQVEQMKLLHIIGLEIAAASDMDRLFSVVVRQTQGVLGYDSFAIFILEGNALALKAASYFPKKVVGLKIPVGKGVVGKCAAGRKTITVGNVGTCDYYIHSGLEGVGSEIAAPIIFGNRLIGVFSIESTRREAFGAEDERVLSILCSQLGVAIRNLELTSSRIGDLETLNQISKTIMSGTVREEILSTATTALNEMLGYDYVGIFMVQGDILVLKSHSIPSEAELAVEIRMGEGIIGLCARRRELVKVDDVSTCEFFIPSGLKGARSTIAVPILFGNRLFGVLGTESRGVAAYRQDDIRIFDFLAASLGVALHNAERVASLIRLTMVDEMTGLFNYRFFRERLEEEILRSRRYGRELSLLLIDLDDFKKINDTYGHLRGDQILCDVAGLIAGNLRRVDRPSIARNLEEEIPARYGGEEFLILLPETDLRGASVAAERLVRLVREKISGSAPPGEGTEGGPRLTASIGVACLRPDESADAFISRADMAMYEAKKKGKNRVCLAD
jgi:diguanylate cyclase (GGDEF)-like protein